MGKKNTCKAHKPEERKFKCYDIAFVQGDKVFHVDVMVSSLDNDGDCLIALKDDEVVGEFKDWIYYVRVDDDEDSVECVRRVDEPSPPDWGKVDGKKF